MMDPVDFHGRVIADRYRVDDVLGEGGMGTVYAGEQISLHRPVAIKVLALDRGKTDLLSSFELAGLTPLRAGMAQIVVTFHLDEDLVLRVTAHDRLGNQTEQIYIRDRLPTPPHDARRS